MIETSIINGKKYTNNSFLQEWDKNPRDIQEQDFERLKRQLINLGQYKPVVVTEHGIIIGGNMRFRAMKFLNEHVYVYNDSDGNEVTVDIRGQFNDVWISEIGFVQDEIPAGEVGTGVGWYATIDGKKQNKKFESQEQAMIEYAISDNDGAGRYDTQALSELLKPHEPFIPTQDYKLELAFPVSMKGFLDGYGPSDKPQGDLPEPKTPGQNNGGGLENENREQNFKVVVLKFTPQQWIDTEMEQRLEMLQNNLGRKNDTDAIIRLIEAFEELYSLSVSDTTVTLAAAMKPYVDSSVSVDLTQSAEDTLEAVSEVPQEDQF